MKIFNEGRRNFITGEEGEEKKISISRELGKY